MQVYKSEFSVLDGMQEGWEMTLRSDGGKLFQMSELQTANARHPKSERVCRTYE